jgi:hypothetical protein
MISLHINKYPPRLFRKGLFLSEDWISCSQIGQTIHGKTLTLPEYLAAEDRYRRAIHRFMKVAGVASLCAHNIESWEENPDVIRNVGLGDILNGEVSPVEGESVFGPRLDNIISRCLREVAWLELVAPSHFQLHFDYDFQLSLDVEANQPTLDAAIAETISDGLFVYR